MARKKADAAPDPEVMEEPVDDLSLGSKDQQLLSRVMRFLIAVQAPRRALRARREGYTKDEHALGWELWRKAAGEDRSLDEFFAEVRGADSAPERMSVLRELDEFENTWFPRVRAIIQRVVPTDSRDEFEAAFFKDLTQQPLGPSVVASVTQLCNRVEALAGSAEPGAKAVSATLATRGFDAAKIAHMRGLIESLQTRPASTGPSIDAAAVRKAQQEQLEALDQLRDWFNDWAVTLRSVFSGNEQIQLGLVVVRREGGTVSVVGDPVPPNPGPSAAGTARSA